MTLFDIDKAIEAFFEENVDPETGEILNIDALEELEMAREQKIENVGLFIKNLEAEADAVENQEKIFADRKKRIRKKIEGLKGFLGYALDGKPFKTDRVVMSFRKSESVLVKDDYLVPDEYCNISVVRKPDKKVLKDALKHGKEIMGVELVEKNNISVK